MSSKVPIEISTLSYSEIKDNIDKIKKNSEFKGCACGNGNKGRGGSPRK